MSWDRVSHIFTAELPCYFAVLSRVHQQQESVGPQGAVVNSDVVPNVSVAVPAGSQSDADTMTVQVCHMYDCFVSTLLTSVLHMISITYETNTVSPM